jgi:amino acid transporter
MHPSAPPATGPGGPPGPAASPITAALDKQALKASTLVSVATTGAAPLTVAAGGAAIAFAVAGTLGIPIAYAAVAVLLAVFAVAYTKMAQLINSRGTFYNYIAHGLGRTVGLGFALISMLAYAAMGVGLIGGFGATAAALLDRFHIVHVSWVWTALAGAAVIGVLGVTRIGFVGRILLVCLYAEVAVALIIAGVLAAHPFGGRYDLTGLNPMTLILAGAGAAAAGMVVAITGFVGFEMPPVFSTETRNPGRVVKAALFITLAGTAIIYTVCSAAMGINAGSGHLIGRAQAEGTDLMFTLAGQYLPTWFVNIGRVLLCTSLFAAALAFHTTASRYVATLGVERVLPQWMGVLRRKTNAPLAGSLTVTGLGVAAILVYAIRHWDPTVYMFFYLTCLGGLGVLALMVAASLAAIVYFARLRDAARQATVWQRVIAPGLALLGLGWILWQTVANFHQLLGVTPDNPARWWLPALYLAMLVVGVVWALILKVGWPDRYARIGTGGQAAATLPGTARSAFPAAAGGAR